MSYTEFQRSWSEGRSEGLLEGRAEGLTAGRLEILFDLMRDGILTIPEAVKRAEIEPFEFERKYNEICK